MKVLDIYGQTVITKLAYKEPTFHSMRKHNKGGVIDLALGENELIILMEQLEHELRTKLSNSSSILLHRS